MFFSFRVNLQEIRAEIVSLRQKFDEDLKVILSFSIHSLQDMRKAITKNVAEMTQLLKPEVVAESKVNSGSKLRQYWSIF